LTEQRDDRLHVSRAIDSFRGNEEALFEERIRKIFKKLQPGFVGKVTCVDERIFQDFVHDADRCIDQVRGDRQDQ
jgi:hypothetical protein